MTKSTTTGVTKLWPADVEAYAAEQGVADCLLERAGPMGRHGDVEPLRERREERSDVRLSSADLGEGDHDKHARPQRHHAVVIGHRCLEVKRLVPAGPVWCLAPDRSESVN